VTLVDTDGRGPDKITETGVEVAGKNYEIDCLIFATGFAPGNYLSQLGYAVVGRTGHTLADTWKQGPRTLHGVMSADFPNCFLLGVTQTGVVPNYHHIVYEQIMHVAHIVDRCLSAGSRKVEVAAPAQQHWVDVMKAKQSSNRSFLEECTPSYFNN